MTTRQDEAVESAQTTSQLNLPCSGVGKMAYRLSVARGWSEFLKGYGGPCS